MSELTHRTVETNGIRMHLTEAGSGPLVVLCHGFPESSYSWRHQLMALAEAGFRAVAPDMRGYGQTERPGAIDQYTLLHHVGDMVGLLDALGAEQGVIAGHDWGGPVAWHAALLRPDRFRAVIGLSVPYRPRGTVRPTTVMPQNENAVFYQLYFQTPGVAEAELERDVGRTIRSILYSAAGDATPRESSVTAAGAVGMVPRKGGFLSGLEDPANLPSWLSEADIAFYTGEFAPHRVHWWPQLVPQHRPQLGAPGPVRRRSCHGPGFVHRGRPRPSGSLPRGGPADSKPLALRAPASRWHYAAWLRPLDPAGAGRGGQRCDDRLPARPG